MPTREQIIRMYGGWDGVPDYLRQGFEAQDEARERRAQDERDHKARIEAEHARIRSLRRPPQNVRLVHRKVFFEPPETADVLDFAGFWVSEVYKGSWTKHGNWLLPDKRSAVLYGEGPCYVETWYHQMKMREMYRSPIVYAMEPVPVVGGFPHAKLIAAVQGYLRAVGRSPLYYERWTRVLAGLGAEEHDNPMTADEAQRYVDMGWGHRWPPIVRALREIEGARQ